MRAQDIHWHSTRLATVVALACWACFAFATAFFARDLPHIVAGWPMYFWLAAQGGPLAFLIITWAYAGWMRHLDHKVREGEGR